MVRPERFELPASWFVARRSIQLSYGRKYLPSGGEGGIVRGYAATLRFASGAPSLALRRLPLIRFTFTYIAADASRKKLTCQVAEREGFEPSKGF